MLKIIDSFCVSQFTMLILDGERPNTHYRKYLIDGKEYEPIPVYDSGRGVIAVESTENFIGKYVEFI